MTLRRVEATGVLVIRVWMEDMRGTRMRARITHTLDVRGRDTTVTIATDPGEIHRTISAWLKAFAEAKIPPLPEHQAE
jgi:hypothetical protein